MSRKSMFWCALVVSLLGCSAESADEAEQVGQGSAALQPEHPPLSCTITGDFARTCRDHGGISTCDDTTAMCCKTTKDENDNPSTFCSSKPEEVRVAPPTPPRFPTAPIAPGIATSK